MDGDTRVSHKSRSTSRGQSQHSTAQHRLGEGGQSQACADHNRYRGNRGDTTEKSIES